MSDNFKSMDNGSVVGSNVGAVLTLLFFVYSQLSLSEAATIVTMVAASTTILLNAYTFYKRSKKKED